jgi:DNA-binding XRE family transcriptional regulator
MKTKNKAREEVMKTVTFDELKDKYIGEKGSPERDAYELELKVEILGEMIKKVRQEKHMTQEELGKLVGVNKSQISKLERNTKNVTIATILKIFRALRKNIKFSIEELDSTYEKSMI